MRHARFLFVLAVLVALSLTAFPAGALESEPENYPKLKGKPPVIADPGMRVLDQMLREGRGTGPRHRAYYDFLVDEYPYSVRIDPSVRTREVETHRRNLLRRDEMKKAGKLAGRVASEWISLGPVNVPGRMTAIALHPTDSNLIYLGGANGGVWRTTDGGTTWESRSDFEGSLAIGALLLDPLDPNTLWAGTGEGNLSRSMPWGAGFLKSTDGALTWKLTALPVPDQWGVRRLDLDPVDHKTMFAAANHGLWKSPDRGETWSLVPDLPSKSWDFMSDLLRDPVDPRILYAANCDTYDQGPAESTPGIWKSTDSGTTWSQSTAGLPISHVGRISLAIAPSDPKMIYAGIENATRGDLLGFYRSTDAGATWTKAVNAPGYCSGQCWYDNALVVDPANSNIVYAAGLDVYRSDDAGETWIKMSTWYLSPGDPKYVHADQHHLVAPHPGEIYVACDGGFFHSTNKGGQWIDLGRGLVTAQFYAITGAEAETQPLLGGLQDNGTVKYTGTTDWKEVYGGDGGFTAVDPTNPKNMLTEYVYASIVRSTNGGTSWRDATAGINQADRVLFIMPFTMDPNNPQRLMAGTFKVYLSTTQGSGWIAASPGLTTNPDSGNVSTMAFDPTDPATAWAGTTDGNVQVTHNLGAGATWTNMAGSPLPLRAVRSIAVDPTNNKRIFVSFSGYDLQTPETPGHVFRTTDGGISWLNVSSGLADAPIRSILIDPDAPSTAYIGTDMGVYASSDNGASWQPLGDKFPFTAVHMLTLNRTLRRLRAGTHGRGVWELDVPVPSQLHSTIVPVAAHSSGANGTFFVTDVRLVNPGTSTANADLWFTPSGSDFSYALARSVQVAPGATLRLDDIVLGTFGLTSGVGRLEIRSATKLIVSARTYNNAAAGTFGQFEAGEDSSGSIDATGGLLHILGLERSEGFRSNLGLVETSGAARAIAQVTLFDESGVNAGTKAFTAETGGLAQINDVFGALGVSPAITRGRAEIRVTSGGRLAAYASVVDNTSGDAVFVPGRPSPADNNTLIVAAAARADGANGSFWRTDLNLFNSSATESRIANLAYLPAGQDGSAAPRRPLTLAPGESRRLEDVVGSFFGNSGIGAVWIETSPIGQGDLIVSGRTYTVDSSGGSYGQFVSARSTSEALGAGRTQILAGAVSTADYRTNAGFVNVSGSRATVTCTLRDAAGTVLGTGNYVVEPYSLTVVGNIAAALGGGAALSEGRIDFTTDSGTVTGYLSVIDNRTNDPIMIPSVEAP